MDLHGSRSVAIFFLLLAVFGPLLLGQAATGTLTGIIMDESESVIPGADVSLVNQGTGDHRRTVSNETGFFSISAIPAGVYTVEIDMPGFALWRRTGVVFRIGDKVNLLDIVMKVAATGEEVTVSAASETIAPTDSGEKAAIITSKQIENLSVVGRSAVELLKTLPGVVYNPEQGSETAGEIVQFNTGIGDYNVAGNRASQVALVSDGADVIDPGCDCGAAVTPNMDMVAEVKVSISNFSAENAKGPMVFQTVSKAGTSEFHGEGYIYLRHNRMNSQDWRANFFNEKKPQDNFYFPGFNIGGPLTPGRDKAFFFAGVEYMHQNVDLGVIPANVPTEKMRKGDFSEIAEGYPWDGYNVTSVPVACLSAVDPDDWRCAVPGGGGISSNGIIDPGLLDPGGQALINLYPMPNRDPATNDGWNYVSNVINPQHRNQELVRIDYSISDKWKLYTRFNHEFQSTPYPYVLWWMEPEMVPYPSELQGDYRTWSSSTSLAQVLNPTTTNEVVFAATYWTMPHQLKDPEKVSRTELGYPYKGLFNNGIDQVPSYTAWGGGFATLLQSGGTIDPGIHGKKWLVSIEDNFSKVVDTHTLKFGARYQWTTNDESTTFDDQGLFEFSSWGDLSTGNAYADLIMGLDSGYYKISRNIIGETRRNQFEFYAQDSWKASRRLTIELGARFSHLGWMYDKNGWMAGFDRTLYDPEAPIEDYSGLVAAYRGDDVPKSVWKTPFLKVAPRVGFAYDLTGSGRTVLRGGGGVFYYHGRGGDSFEGTIANPPLASATYFCCGNPISYYDTIDPNDLEAAKASLTTLEPYSDRVPSTYSFSMTVSQRLPWDIFWETSYVGSISHHQLTSDGLGSNINIVPEGAMFGYEDENPDDFRIFTSYGSISSKRHALSQNYNALHVMLNRQTGSLNFSVAYAFGKALGIGGHSYGDDVDNFDFRRRSYGHLGYDRTHSLSIAYNYMLPDVTENRGLGYVLNGWQLTGITQFQSGAPLRSGSSPGGIGMSGDTAASTPIEAIYIAGTPDTSAQPYLVCDPREGLGPNQWVNPSCFTAPSPGNNGHYQFPYIKGPGFQNHDLSVFKNFAVGGGERRLQFRLSMFNFLNHPQPFFSGDQLNLAFSGGELEQETIDTFGRPTLKRGRRLIQLAFKYSF